ncbi:MAG TPA: GGDEF domain-containing protein [Bosea sp. (in: a-proteobacteria)]|uniref:GGDEF domain-containing protein n=1 Tax=Bosea sp. (in: a-proteobacteria) TaxID=1871050 RepID=UPI002DDCD520|nr:GGDEF domain-containing protein [Bosea sp. (in: a-proteobacteria)]HEV2556264.1 GGDEF domain-containing protein [Bosea sp. (in: a-proteobacteria)]
MPLDLRTIYAVAAATSIILGLLQLSAFATGRFGRWPLWWGLSSLLIGAGIILVVMRGTIPDAISMGLANTLTWAGYLLVLVSVRSFAGLRTKPWHYGLAVVAPMTLLMLWIEPGGFPRRAALVALLMACCDAAVAREGFRLARKDGLRSAWILVALFLPTSALFVVRAILALNGHLGEELFPPQPVPMHWTAVGAAALVLARGNALLLLAAERSGSQLAALAESDPLTGAMNRSGLERAVAALAGQAGRPQRAALLLIDIDHFKALNDTHGHAAGDQVLRLFADVARSQLRAGDIVARHGGDEFVVMLPGLGIEAGIRIAERLQQAFARAITARPELPGGPTLSIGVTEGDTSSQPLDQLLLDADSALYRSKRLGRDRVQSRQEASVG